MTGKNTEEEIVKIFGNRLRLRVSGICLQEDSILLVRHHSLGEKGILWAPPGGGLLFGESATDALKREFMEETGFDIEVGDFLFVNEFMEPPLHAVELFFEIKIKGGKLIKGSDPEIRKEHQIINKVEFVSFEALRRMDPATLHQVLQKEMSPDILHLKGYKFNGQ